MTMVVGLYDSVQAAHGAVTDLIDAGFSRGAVSFLMRSGLPLDVLADAPANVLANAAVSVHSDRDDAVESDDGKSHRVLVAGPLAAAMRGEAYSHDNHDNQETFLRALTTAGISRPAAFYFAEAICSGAILVAIHCEDKRIRDARDILDGHAPADPLRWS